MDVEGLIENIEVVKLGASSSGFYKIGTLVNITEPLLLEVNTRKTEGTNHFHVSIMKSFSDGMVGSIINNDGPLDTTKVYVDKATDNIYISKASGNVVMIKKVMNYGASFVLEKYLYTGDTSGFTLVE